MSPRAQLQEWEIKTRCCESHSAGGLHTATEALSQVPSISDTGFHSISSDFCGCCQTSTVQPSQLPYQTQSWSSEGALLQHHSIISRGVQVPPPLTTSHAEADRAPLLRNSQSILSHQQGSQVTSWETDTHKGPGPHKAGAPPGSSPGISKSPKGIVCQSASLAGTWFKSTGLPNAKGSATQHPLSPPKCPSFKPKHFRVSSSDCVVPRQSLSVG